ncbi:unnamed protein product [Heterobilharzia americana]|nr:unnamed protein product [Heterobilharzia americana]CAH8446559.1 unnamed protein product [Heterobilharzia americana]
MRPGHFLIDLLDQCLADYEIKKSPVVMFTKNSKLLKRFTTDDYNVNVSCTYEIILSWSKLLSEHKQKSINLS